jgi:hypothetical protein
MWLRASDVAAASDLNDYRSPREVAQWYISKITQTKKEFENRDYEISCKDSAILVKQAGTEEQNETVVLIDKIAKIKKENIPEFVKKQQKEIIISSENKIKTKKLKVKDEKIIKEYIEKINTEKCKKIKFVEEISKEISENKDIKKIVRTNKAILVKKIIEQKLEEAVVSKEALVSKKIEQEIVCKLPESVKKISNSYINKERGIREESKIVNSFEEKTNSIVTDRNNCTYSGRIEDIKIFGRIDGYSEKNGLIEVKHRRNRLFNKIPVYEKVQCEVYMILLDIDKCTHIERYDGKDVVTEYSSDIKLIQKIKAGLEEYKILYRLLSTCN